MKTHFTCPCGNRLEIESENWFMAQQGVVQAGWQPRPQTIACYDCPGCSEAKRIGLLDENA